MITRLKNFDLTSTTSTLSLDLNSKKEDIVKMESIKASTNLSGNSLLCMFKESTGSCTNFEGLSISRSYGSTEVCQKKGLTFWDVVLLFVGYVNIFVFSFSIII